MITVVEADGVFRVATSDGVTLYESKERTAAYARASMLSEIVDLRQGRATSEELLVLFPPTAPAPLVFGTLSASSAGLSREDVFHDGSKTWSMRNVEIFREGEAFKQKADGSWHKIAFTADDVVAFVEAFTVLGWQPPVKITHSGDQRMLLAELPSIARVTSLRAAKVQASDGCSVMALFADLERVPEVLRDAIGQGKFPQRSIEFWRNSIPRPKGQGTLALALKAIALLGEDLPAVRGMPALDIAPAKFDASGHSEMVYTHPMENRSMSDPAKSGDVVTLSAEEYAKQKQLAESLKAENDRLKATQDEQQKRLDRLEIDRRVEAATGLASRVRESGKITPAQEPYVVALLKSLDDEQKDAVAVTLSTKDGPKEEKCSVRGAFVRFLDTLSVHPNAPGAAQTRGDKTGGTGVASFASLDVASRSALVAKLGEAYEADKAKGFASKLAAYDAAQKDLASGRVAIEEVK